MSTQVYRHAYKYFYDRLWLTMFMYGGYRGWQWRHQIIEHRQVLFVSAGGELVRKHFLVEPLHAHGHILVSINQIRLIIKTETYRRTTAVKPTAGQNLAHPHTTAKKPYSDTNSNAFNFLRPRREVL